MPKKRRASKARTKSSPPKPARSSRIILRLVILLVLAGGVAVAAAFFWVDRRVTHALMSRDLSKVSSIYSAPLRLSGAAPPSAEAIRAYLTERHYRDVTGALSLPGEYHMANGVLTVYTREFRGPSNETVPARKVRFDLTTGTLTSLEEGIPNPSAIVLEPTIISTLGSGDQRASNYKKLADIPEQVKYAVIAVEDERFYSHYGVDPIGILRAMFQNLKAMAWIQGGSTLTQQLAKNTLFTPEKTLGRKALEILSAFSLERHLSKDEILEMYLNEVYLGQEGPFALHGVAEACSAYFGKNIDEITVAEAALLAGIIRAPSYNSPRKHPERALERKNVGLEKMRDLGFIDQALYQKARAQKIAIVQESRNKRGAPFYTAELEQELSAQFSLDAAVLSGLTVFSGIDSEMQQCAERVLPAGLEKLEKKYPKLAKREKPIEAALVAIEPHSGLVKAWVGGRDFSTNQFNHVNQAQRQIGSTIKPFLYLTALDSGLNSYKTATVTSILSDEPTKIDLPNAADWTPENFDHRFRGDVTLRYALENSLNLPAVYVSQRVGIPSVVKTIERFGLAENVLAVPSVALGAIDTNLLKLTAAYAALANGGRFVAPRLFISAIDNNDEVLGASVIREADLADERAVFVLTNIMQGVLERGTARVVRAMGYSRPAAGKTGTSNDTRDGWFVGFTPNLAVGVWVGFDDNSKIGLTGGTLAAPIWTEFMQCVEKFHEPLEFLKPAGVKFVELDGKSSELATDSCPRSDIITEVFVEGTEPLRWCRLHSLQPEDRPPSEDLLPPQEERPRRRRSLWDQIFG